MCELVALRVRDERVIQQAMALAVTRLRAKQAALASEQTNGPVDWLLSRFVIPELSAPIILETYQAACLAEALSTDADGLFHYSTVVWSDIKKSAKSCLAAGIALWWADTHPWSSIKIVANDLKQADSREAFYARRAIELNRDYFLNQREVKVQRSGYTIKFPLTHSIIEAVPIDPTGEAGGNDDLIIFVELWGAKNQAAQRMYTEMTLSPTKFRKSIRWVETYAGFVGEAPILESLYEQGVTQGRRIDLSHDDAEGHHHDLSDLEVFANDAARLFCLWNTVPRLPWQTPEYYAEEAAMLQPNQFQRIHRNQWVGSEAEAIPIEWWDACHDPIPLDPKDKTTPIVLAADASVSGDCTALNAVSRHPTLNDHVVQRGCQAWVPPLGGKIDYDLTLTPSVDWWLANHNVVEIAYDEYQLHHWANQQRQKPIPGWYRPFAQGPERLKADKQLVDMVRERKIHQLGNAVQREHIGNCNAKIPVEEPNRLRLVKKSEARKIDLGVTLSMATYECMRLML